MNPALVYLNAVVDGRGRNPVIEIPPEDAREALRTLELYLLACGALDTLLKHPGDKEGIAHAERCLAHLNESKRRAEVRAAERKAVAREEPTSAAESAKAAPARAAAASVPDAGDDASDLI